MGRRPLVTLAIEGKFASEGLQDIDGEDGMLTAMARELVENNGIGESARAPHVRAGIPVLSEGAPLSPDGEQYPQPSSHRREAEQLPLL